MPPISLYIHFPWCIRKCPYCDFNSHAVKQPIPQAEYLAALLADFNASKHLLATRKLASIFIGGGTPSLISSQSLAELLSCIAPYMAQNIEITLEANPGTFDVDKFAEFLAAGINRLSIGVQSFNQQHLAKLGRIHSGQEAVAAATRAQQLGFANINLDIIYGLPGQTLAQAAADLQQAISLAPQHISYYQLTLEPNTYFYAYPPLLPSDDLTWAMQQQGEAILAAAGFSQYEVSAYSRQRQCQHNLNYWQFGDYLGIGAGAHGKISQAEKIIRTTQSKQPQRYMQDMCQGRPAVTKTLSQADIISEFMLNALRLTDGCSLDVFEQTSGLDRQLIAPQLHEAQARKLLIKQADYIRPTALGRRFLNDLQQIFLV